LAFIWVFPIIWVILTSFRAEKGSYVSTFFPQSYTLDNYIRLFTDTSILNFPQMFMNTLFIAICSCILSTFYVLAASYCLSRLRFKLRKPYMNMAMILGLFPGFMSMIAVYFILKAIGLTEGNLIKLALILCYSGGAASRLPVALRSSASAKLYQKWSKTPELRGFRGFSFSNGLTQFDRTKPLLTRFLWVKWWTTTPKRGLMG